MDFDSGRRRPSPVNENYSMLKRCSSSTDEQKLLTMVEHVQTCHELEQTLRLFLKVMVNVEHLFEANRAEKMMSMLMNRKFSDLLSLLVESNRWS